MNISPEVMKLIPDLKVTKIGNGALLEDSKRKSFRSVDYSYHFDKSTGFFLRWGKTPEDDPQFSQFGPEILDIEVTEKCEGVVGNDGIRKPCSFCYKSNTPQGNMMSFDKFKLILDKMPKATITQCALGADSTGTSNPDMFKMMEYARSIGIIPNLTIADVTDEIADKLSKICGAVAVSRYENKNICYDSVKKLTDRGMTQVNIHHVVHANNIDQIKETFNDIKNDPRLEKLNAIVLLSLKQKGRGEKFNTASFEQFKEIIDLAFELKLNFGMDSCSATKFLEIIKGKSNFKELEQSVEPCESTCFSSYISTSGEFFPCSFCEKIEGWEKGIEITENTDFLKDVWNHEKTIKFRENLIRNNRSCPVFKI